jgi:hypothetical protein
MHHRLLLLSFLLCSCSTGFNRDWNAAKLSPSADGLAGAWEGSWLSGSNGHSGSLRAVIGPEAADGQRDVRYRATWAKVLSGGFTAKHRFVKQGNQLRFQGSESLGKFGSFSYDGSVKGSDFHATYKAAGDTGTFDMKRATAE